VESNDVITSWLRLTVTGQLKQLPTSIHCIKWLMLTGHLKLLPTSTLDICKVFEHIDMLSMGILQQPQTVIPTQLGSVFGVLAGHLWSQTDVTTTTLRFRLIGHLKLFPTSIH